MGRAWIGGGVVVRRCVLYNN